MNRIAATILGMEALVVVLAVPVALNVAGVATAAGWVSAAVTALVCIGGAATVRSGRVGYVLGSLAQVGAVGMGFLIPIMFVLGGIFAVLWVVLLRLGPEVEAAKRARQDGG